MMVGPIVVGVDGSPASALALHWSLAEAKLRGAPLRVVHAWSAPVLVTSAGAVATVDESFRTSLREGGSELVARLLEESGAASAGVEIERVIVEGRPAPTLVREAREAALLVVGSRGHGGFAGLLLGSVSQQCAHHAHCPVVIVPPPDEAE
jgi:nucleotide-binding universal stress UspA family protein